MKWPVIFKVPLPQHSGCRKWFLAAKVRWRVFMSLHIQHFHRLVQIYKATLWSEMGPRNLSTDHGLNGWRFGWCGGLYGWCNSGWWWDNAWQAKKMWNTFVFACSKFHQYIYGRNVIVETDHRPLEAVSTKPLSQAPLRFHRMLLSLRGY